MNYTNQELADAIEEMSREDRTYILTAAQVRDFPVNIHELFLEGKLPNGSGINRHVIKNVLGQLEGAVSV